MEEVADKVGFSLREPKYRLADLAISEQCRQALQVLQNRIKHHDVLYQDWGLKEIDPYSAHRAINLYGPPGTGKSMCAEALAAEFGKNIIDIDYAEVESKYVGETPKKIRGAFRLAAETDAVLFFDEADSILGRRMTDVTQAADQSVNVARAVMLKELDRHPGIIIFATNLARNFDAAFIRRILVHVEIPLPDEASRRLIWMRFIPARVPGRDLIDWATLAQNSEGLSGGEIKNAAIIALSSAVARPARLLMMQDLSTAIDHVKRAQRDVGSLGSPLYSPRPVLSTEAVAGRAK
jgi:SpoVK/Ycf46/Vps4 family AAA+-type ATPase